MGFLERFINLVSIAVFTGFLLIPVAFLSAYPEAVPQWTGSLLADYCLRTGLCDFRLLKAGLGASLFLIITLFISWLEALRPTMTNWEIEDTIEDIDTSLLQLSHDVSDLREEQEETKQEDMAPRQLMRRNVAGGLAALSIVFFMLAWWGSGKLPALLTAGPISAEIPAADIPLLALIVMTVLGALFFSGAVWHYFWDDDEDKELLWEKNFIVRSLYRGLGEKQSDEGKSRKKYYYRKFVVVLSVMVMAFFAAVSIYIKGVFNLSEIWGWLVITPVFPLFVFDIYLLFMMAFFPDRVMFWENNQYIQQLYQEEDQSEA